MMRWILRRHDSFQKRVKCQRKIRTLVWQEDCSLGILEMWKSMGWNYRDGQVSVYFLRELHPLALLPVDVDHEAVHLAAEPAYEPRDHGLVRAAHLCCPRSLPRGLRAPTHSVRVCLRCSGLTDRLRAIACCCEGVFDRETFRLFLSSRSPRVCLSQTQSRTHRARSERRPGSGSYKRHSSPWYRNYC